MDSHERSGWSALPPDRDAGEPAALPPDDDSPRAAGPVQVVGLGAVCDLDQTSDDGRSVSFSVSEFAVLDDGRRMTVRGDLGFTAGRGSAASGTSEVWTSMTTESVTRDVLTVVLPDDVPDDDDSGEEHPWEWLAELARERGLDVTAEDLRTLPYEVHLTDRVHGLLSTD